MMDMHCKGESFVSQLATAIPQGPSLQHIRASCSYYSSMQATMKKMFFHSVLTVDIVLVHGSAKSPLEKDMCMPNTGTLPVRFLLSLNFLSL